MLCFQISVTFLGCSSCFLFFLDLVNELKYLLCFYYKEKEMYFSFVQLNYVVGMLTYQKKIMLLACTIKSRSSMDPWGFQTSFHICYSINKINLVNFSSSLPTGNL